MSNKEKKEKSNELKNTWFIAGVVVSISAILIPFLFIMFSSTEWTITSIGKLGAFGDYFGGSTIGLLSLASILFIVHTIQIQSKELSLQRRELELTREEMEKTREEHNITNKTMKIQSFDSTFFNMIKMYNSIVENIIFREKSSRLALRHIWRRLYNSIQSEVILNPSLENNHNNHHNSEDIVRDNFEEFYKESEYMLGHYFRNLYRIVKFIEDSSLDEEEKKNYRGILRAQLSSSELYLLFYNLNFSSRGEKFYKLLEGTDFFQDHLDGLILGDNVLSHLNKKKYEDLLSK